MPVWRGSSLPTRHQHHYDAEHHLAADGMAAGERQPALHHRPHDHDGDEELQRVPEQYAGGDHQLHAFRQSETEDLQTSTLSAETLSQWPLSSGVVMGKFNQNPDSLPKDFAKIGSGCGR